MRTSSIRNNWGKMSTPLTPIHQTGVGDSFTHRVDRNLEPSNKSSGSPPTRTDLDKKFRETKNS